MARGLEGALARFDPRSDRFTPLSRNGREAIRTSWATGAPVFNTGQLRRATGLYRQLIAIAGSVGLR